MSDPTNHEHFSDEEIYERLAFRGRDAEFGEIESCPVCRATAESLMRALEQLPKWTPPKVSEDYGADVWRRIASKIQEVNRPKRLPVLWVFAAAAVAAVIAVFLVAGRQHQEPGARRPVTISNAGGSNQLLLDVAVRDHMKRAELLLTHIETEKAEKKGNHSLVADRAAINNLVAESRLYRQTAEQQNDQRAVSLLTDIERSLVSLKHDTGGGSGTDVRELRKKLLDGKAWDRSVSAVPVHGEVINTERNSL
jgi:hypothetical protein